MRSRRQKRQSLLKSTSQRTLLCMLSSIYDMIIFFFKLFLGFIYLFIYGCAGSSFLCEGFLQLRQVGATLHRRARASHYRGLSCWGAQAPDAQAQ